MTDVYAIGTGTASHEDCQGGVFEDPIRQAAMEALDDAGMNQGQIDSVMMAGYDTEVGRTISNMYAVSPSGGYLKDEARITDDGLAAMELAVSKIRRGGYDTIMLTGYGFPETSLPYLDNLSYDPLYARDLGMTDITANALQAKQYTDEHDLDRSIPAQIVEKNRRNGEDNPDAQLQESVDAEEAEEADLMATPLREHDVSPESYGIVSIVLTIPEYAARYGSPVHIESMGWNNDTYYLGEKDLAWSSSLEAAAEDAYEYSSVEDPMEDLDIVELTEPTSYHELIAYETLGLCDRGEAAELVENGATEPDGETPVNVSGGTLSWDPSAAAGLAGFVEVMDQIRGRAGDSQLDGVERGLAQGTGRNAMQTNFVAILEESNV